MLLFNTNHARAPIILLRYCFPTFGLKRGICARDAPNVLTECLHLFLRVEIVADELTREDVVTLINGSLSAKGPVQPLQLLKIDFEVFLATDPVLMILGHLKRVFNRWQRLNWHLIYQVSLLEVFFKVEAEDGRWLAT